MSAFIVVERDTDLKDRAVFTGQIQIVDARLMFWDEDKTRPHQCIDGVASPHIEHAFVFNAAWSAWRFAMQFEPHWDRVRRRYWGFRRWVVRNDDEFFPGEVRHGIDVRNPCTGARSWIPQEALVAASDEGFRQGRASALREIGKEAAA